MQLRVELVLHHCYVFEQLVHAFERIVFTLDGDEDFLDRVEGVGGQKPQGGRAVDENIVEAGFFDEFGAERVPKPVFAANLGHQFDFNSGQVDGGWDAEQIAVGGGPLDHLFGGAGAEEEFITGDGSFPMLHP